MPVPVPRSQTRLRGRTRAKSASSTASMPKRKASGDWITRRPANCRSSTRSPGSSRPFISLIQRKLQVLNHAVAADALVGDGAPGIAHGGDGGVLALGDFQQDAGIGGAAFPQVQGAQRGVDQAQHGHGQLPHGFDKYGRRRGGGLFDGCKGQVFRHGVALNAFVHHPAPGFALVQHHHLVKLRDGAEHLGAVLRLPPQVQRAFLRGDGGGKAGRRNGGRGRGGGKRRHRDLRKGKIAGHHVALGAFVNRSAPGIACFVNGNLGVLGNGAQYLRVAVRGGAQVQGAFRRADPRCRHGRRGKWGGCLRYEGLRSRQRRVGGQQRHVQRIQHPHAAGVVKAQDLVVGVAHEGHLHGSPLAHAHAVAVAPGGDHKGVAALRHRPELVFRAVDAHAQRAFQLAENIEGDDARGYLSVQRVADLEIHFAVQTAGVSKSRRMGRNGMHGGDGDPVSESRGGFFIQQTGQPAALRIAAAHAHAEHPRVGIAQVVGVVLNDQVVRPGHVPGVLHRFRLPAVGGGVIGGGIFAAVLHCDAAGFVHGPAAVFVAGGRAVVHLVGGGVHQVKERGGLLHGVQGIGAGGDGLGFQRFQAGGIAHFVGQHAVEVILYVYPGHHIQGGTLCRELQVAGIDVLRDPALGDFHAAGQPRQAEGRAQIADRAACHQGQLAGAFIEAHRRRAAAVERLSVHGIGAAERQFQRGWISQGQKAHPHDAVLETALAQGRAFRACLGKSRKHGTL